MHYAPTPRRQRAAGLAGSVTVLLVAILAGCTVPRTDLEFGAPTAGPRPAPMIDAACEEVLVDEALAISFRDQLDPVDPVLSDLATDGIPVAAAVRTVGGLACEWSNGVPYSPSGADGYVGVRVLVLPDARVEWEAYGIGTGNLEEVADVCARRVEPIVCTTSAMTRGTWSQATAIGADAVEAALAVTNSAANSSGFGVVAGAPWNAPDTSIGRCDTALDAATVGATLGASVEYGLIEAGSSFADAITERAGAVGCGILLGDEFQAAVHVLPGGGWAWRDADLATTGDTVEIAGVDAAVIACTAAGQCRLDALVGDDWVRIATVDGVLTAAEVAERLAAAIAATDPSATARADHTTPAAGRSA